ncbi:hypothetical protein COM86_21710 [Priestia megaterium]|uniref:AAA family ATPase n=1 Tax=Priestia megaterium TaxID=1404 RepID=UPI000BECAD74|nr:SMC family ATPase [Priestia megaterium]PEB61979.1 hypothetical protein COM86_21710 [Priestia megaterium]
MKIQAITLEAFRGFLDKVTFNIQDTGVLLLYGPNGHGKTSIFDAIEWALTGEIQRFSVSTEERKRTRFIRNLHAQEDQITYVTLNLLIDSTINAQVKRICTVKKGDNTDYGKHKLEILCFHPTEGNKELEGSEAEDLLRTWLINETWLNKITDSSRIISLTHILGQEKLNEFVMGMKDGERYSSLSVLFGTEHFLKYSDLFKNSLEGLKNELQLRRGRILEVETSIKNIEKNSEVLEKKLVSDTKEPLKKALLPYVNYFNNTKNLYEVENWEEFHIAVHKNQEKLREERFQLENSAQHLKDAKDLFPKWKTSKQFLIDAPKKREELNKWLNYTQNLNQVESLLERFPHFQAGLTKKDKLRVAIERKVSVIQKLSEKSNTIDELVHKLRTIFKEALEKKDFKLFTTISTLSFEDKEIKLKLISYLEKMKEARNSIFILRENYEINKSALSNLEKSFHELQGVDKKFQELLSALNDYIVVQNDIEACPACGTPGISIDHLKKRVVSEQGRMNTTLPQLELQIKETKKQMEVQFKEITTYKEQFNSSIDLVNKLIENLEEKAKETRDSRLREQRYEQQLHNEVSALTDFLNVFKQDANKLQIDASKLNFIDTLKQLEQELQSSLLPLSLKDRADLSNQVQLLERKIQHAREVINYFIGKLEKLDVNVKDLRLWSEEQITLFLSEISNIQSHSIEVLHEKEKVTFKALSILDQAKDELQLLTYNKDLKRQLQSLKTLNQEKDQIEKDCESVQEILLNIKKAVDTLNNKMIDELFDTVQKVFVHINSHPLYNKLEFSKEHRNRAYRLLIYALTGQSETEVPANASYIFSSAQVNSIALSFFIAMALHQNWSPLQLIGLDDPIQSMDEINVLAFIDLLRLFVEQYNRQIIISTHDYTFYKMMLRKFRFQNVSVIEYEGYSEKGPSIRTQENESNNEIQLVQYYPQLKIEKLTGELYKLDHKL